jgi:hypothetical protein
MMILRGAAGTGKTETMGETVELLIGSALVMGVT